MASATPPIDEAFRAQRRREIRLAAPFRSGVGWRIVAEAIWGFAAWVSVIALALAGWLPYWLACLTNGWIAYLMYLPLHEAILRGQDRHILHHMFPRVPHYRLPALFARMRPILERHDARIEGPLAGPGAPKILLHWDESMRARPDL